MGLRSLDNLYCSSDPTSINLTMIAEASLSRNVRMYLSPDFIGPESNISDDSGAPYLFCKVDWE
jgi:hypothetical protein